MSKVIYVYSRNPLPASVANRLEDICSHLAPDNITPTPPRVLVKDNIAYGVMNPSDAILESGKSILLGRLIESDVKWEEAAQESLDGSFALFRNRENSFEVLSDPAGSRTIWYYLDKEVFVSSTSQRAITMFLGSFQFDEKVIPWMLSTGTLGPSHSWDRRIERVPPDSAVLLNKTEWSLSMTSNTRDFSVSVRSQTEHEKGLREALENTIHYLNLDFSTWVLPLSGGYDSRCILCLLRESAEGIEGLRTVTWGLRSSSGLKSSDAYVANELANSLNVSNTYYHTDLSDEPLPKIINRFLLLGEGRIDHLSGYLDGFGLWKTLFEEGIRGVVRGDQSHSPHEVSSALTVRHSVGCALCSDFRNLRDYQQYGFPTQELPEELLHQDGDTLSQWRDNMCQGFFVPTIMASLSDLKLSYVEVITPLLSRMILQQIRQLPDHLRTGRILFREIVASLSPHVGFATYNATASLRNVLRQKEVVEMFQDELSSKSAKSIFPAPFLDDVLKGLSTDRVAKKSKLGLPWLEDIGKKFVPRSTVNLVLDHLYSPTVSQNRLAFRLFLISRMISILNQDSNRLNG